MNRFQAVFGKGRVLLPVIHYKDHDAALESLDVAVRAGAKGVFLINQGPPGTAVDRFDLERLRAASQAAHPGLWVGVNRLEFGLRYHEGYDGTWADNADAYPNPDALTRRVRDLVRDPPASKPYLYFGGVAFAAKHLDVIVTSGPVTGTPPSVTKIQVMRAAIDTANPEIPLGIASGISPENVSEFLPYAQVFLVASAIEVEFGVLDYDKTARLADRISTYA